MTEMAGGIDVRLGDAEDLPQVIENLALKGYCAIDASVCGELPARVVSEVERRFAVGRFQTPPSIDEVHIADGLLGREGSSRIAQLTVPDQPGGDTAARDGRAVCELDGLLTELSTGLMQFMPSLGSEATTRTVGMLHEASKTEQPPQELTEAEASMWMGTYTQHRLMVLFFLGPDAGTLELGLFGDEEAAAVQEITTGPSVMVVLRPDVVSRKHHLGPKGKALCLSCFCNSTRELRRPTEPAPAPYRDVLAAWIQARLKELKDLEAESDTALHGIPRQWVRAMNSQFYRGQQACVRSSACKLPGPVGWETYGLFPSSRAGADFVVEVPAERFSIDDYFYERPKDELWVDYKSYSRHGSFIDGADLFDNKHFSIMAQAARNLVPSEKWGLEVGYEALVAAGWDKKKLARAKGDVLTGVHATENQFNSKCSDTGVFGPMGSVAREANMISFTLNIMGQSLTFDTDGSSSATALWQGQLEQSDSDEQGRNSPFSLVLGTAWNIAPACFANFCQRRLLTTAGRCFSFDEHATGFVRGEGCGGVVLDHLYKVVEGDAVVESNGEGIVRAAEMMQCGKGAVLAAPSGVVMQETMAFAARSGGMQPGDIDVLECHAPGQSMADASEANALSKVLRDRDEVTALSLTDMKTMLGSTYAAAGMTGFLRALHCLREGHISANNLIRCLNPHIDMDEKSINLVTEPMLHPVDTTGFVAVNSFGSSGTYVTAIVWGDRMELFTPPEEPGRGAAPCVFWPAGGGELDEEAVPQSAYYLVGSFGRWAEEPVKMQEAGPGVFEARLVLGDNRLERFQIWLDGSEKRVLHPARPRAPRRTAVHGPEEREACGEAAWQIDGRPLQLALEPAGNGDSETKLVEVPNKDRGEPGTQYLVRLKVAGKYRLVDWELTKDGPATPATSSYSVVASWSNWDFQEMTRDSRTPSRWTCEATLENGVGEFSIIRNRDWSQAFYPADTGYVGKSVYGPDDWGRGHTWVIDGNPGDVFRVEFNRTLEAGRDDREVTWSFLRTQQTDPRGLD